jgi:D-glycero-alpha-D-manno-heptose-7-phosphate kinase
MRIVVARAPGRVSLAGGGTDLPAYYEQRGGAVVSFAIPACATAVISERTNGLDLVSLDHGVHELVTHEKYARRMGFPFLAREFLTMQKAVAWQLGLDRARVAAGSELPAGGGLGSSAAICAALVAAAAAYIGEPLDRRMIAASAARVEMSILRRPCGKQDHYAAAFGGMNLIEFGRDGTTSVTPIEMSPAHRGDIERHLMLFGSGDRRDAAGPLTQLVRRIGSDKQTMIALGELQETAYLLRTAIERGAIKTIGSLVDRAWRAKRRLHPMVTTPQIDRLYAMARDAGALGGKLCGAGLTGAMLFVCPPERQAELAQVMGAQGWRATQVAINDSGAALIEQTSEEATGANRG